MILSCNEKNKNRGVNIYQKKRNNIINLENKIDDIKTDILLGRIVQLNTIDNYLIVTDLATSSNKGIHVYNKNSLKYITSTGIIGQGPGELTRYGRIGIDNINKNIWVPDHGKMVMWKFEIDSILNNPLYKPSEKLKLNHNLFLERFDFLNDSIILGKAVRVLSNNSFSMVTAKLNFKKNEAQPYGYENPKAIGKKSNSFFKLSKDDNFYVNCYLYLDLITICDLGGNVKFNIYGPDTKNDHYEKSYYQQAEIINDYIIASYNGEADIIINEHKRPVANNPSKFLIFKKDGTYIETIELGNKFTFFCVDKENKRVIVYFENREHSLGYFNLNI